MNRNHIEVWNNCLCAIQDEIPPKSYRTWFEPVVPVSLESNVLTLQVPSHFFYEYLEEKFIDVLSKVLRTELGVGAKLEYSVVVENNEFARPLAMKVPANNNPNTRNKPIVVPSMNGKQLKNPFEITSSNKINIDSQLNPSYTFGNYIEGECNRLARSAGMAISNKPGGTAFNPLVLYGNSGLGKTHLAQAIGLEVKQNHPDKTVLYVSTNKFQTQFTEAIRNNEVNDFLHFYQLIDVLIIDDIQELAGKTGTQNTFFHIFNHLHQSGKQLILTSDKSPADLKGMEDRLISRFKWGLSAEIQPPSYETRLTILKMKAYADGIDIPDNVLEYLAGNVRENIRELEGALISMLAQATLNKKELTIDIAESILGVITKAQNKELTVDVIQQVVCDYFNMPIDLLQAKTRKREVVQARQIAMYFCKHLTKSSLSAIGAQVGKKDHATVLYACKTVANLVDTDKAFKSQVDIIARKLKMSQF